MRTSRKPNGGARRLLLAAANSAVDLVDRGNAGLGKAASWLYLLLMAVVVLNVFLRYVLDIGLIEFEEIQWHLYAAAFLLGFAWTYVDDEHVRADLFRERLSPRGKAWIECLGCLFLLFPFTAAVAIHSFDFTWRSWVIGERSDVPSGLPARYVIKSVLSAALVCLSLQALATALRNLLFLAGARGPRS